MRAGGFLSVLGPGLGLLGLAAQAQEAATPPPPTVGLPAEDPIPPNPYDGVVPGTPNPPPRAAQIERAEHALLTWPGFQMTSGGSRIFVQTSRPATFQEAHGPGRMVLTFKNCRIHMRNNRNPLVTRHFNTPVRSAYLRSRRRDVDLVLELRSDVRPMVSQGPGEGGFHFVFIDFPSGEFLPPGADADPVPSITSSPDSIQPAEEGEEPLREPSDMGVGPSP